MSGALTFQQGDQKWKELRHRALTDLYWFASVVLGYGDKFALTEETHRLPLLFADRRTGVPELDEAPYQLILWPRETGKSSCVTIARSVRNACKNPNTAILIANEKRETASDFLASIKQHFTNNELLRALFPEVIPPDLNDVTWSATRATLKRSSARPETTFDSIGVEGTVTGKHFDEIVCDDLISKEAMENARSGNWTIMHRANRWINQLPPLLSASAKPFPSISFIGTRWYFDDCYDHIRTAFGRGQNTKRFRIRCRIADGRIVSRECERVGDLAVMTMSAIENGCAVFPNIWPTERVEAMMFTDPEFAACNLLNNPSNAAVATFQPTWLRYWQHVDTGNHTIVYEDAIKQKQFVTVRSLFKTMAVDPAASSGGEGARNAIVVLGTDQATGKHFVLDVAADRSDPKDLVQDILNVAEQWDVHNVHVELAGQQLYVIQWLEREAKNRGYPLVVTPLKPGGRNKDLRIGGLVIPFKNGDLYCHASQTALISDEYLRYRPGAAKRDVLDALAYALEVCPKPTASGSSAKERSRQQLAAYHARLKRALNVS